LQELISIACIQRKFVHRPVVDYCAELRASGIDKRRFGSDVDNFLRLAHLHGGIQSDDLIDIECDAVANDVLESLQIVTERISSDGKIGENIIAAIVAHRLVRNRSAVVRGGDFDSGQDRAGGICNAPQNATASTLRRQEH
jgi:hypothetical protein